MKVEYEIFIDDNLTKSFSNSGCYDTTTPFHWCLNQLTELKEELINGKTLVIINRDKTFNITNNHEFKNWLENVFGGGFENYLYE